jgi:Arc/MetJ family transcription regulator
MRTNIVIDDKLIADAMAASGATSKKAAVEMGLRALIRQQALAELKSLRGKITWTGDLDAMRRD